MINVNRADALALSDIQDKIGAPITPEVKSQYAYWRIRIMYSLIIGYAAFYLVRQNFSMAMPSMITELGYTKTQLGMVITIWSIVYGIGKFVNGFFSDRSNARFFMVIGLLGSALTSLIMGMGESILFFSIFWASNAWFQSMGWPPVSRLLTHWFSPKELGTMWGLCNISHQIGGAIIAILAGFLIHHYGWRSAFFIPSAIVIGIALILFNRLRDTPQSLGLPSVEQYSGIIKEEDNHDDSNLSSKELIYRVLNNRLLWYVCLGNMFLYIVRMGVFNWAPTFLKELKGVSLVLSGWQVAGFEIAGTLGGLAAGWLSDKVFAGRRGPVSVLYMIALVGSLFYFWFTPGGGHGGYDALAMMAVGFLVYGPQVLVGVAAADFASKKAVGMAVGLTGTFGYLGSALSGICVGWIADHYGWSGGFIFFVISAALGAVCFALTWHHRARVLEESKVS
jgi:phosphoglycerate transporter family protein